MTRHVYLDRTYAFTERPEAVAFAQAKMGRSGTILDTTTTTAEQLAEHHAREARTRAAFRKLVP